VPKSGHLTITKIENLHTDTRKKFTDSKMLFFSIYDEKCGGGGGETSREPFAAGGTKQRQL